MFIIRKDIFQKNQKKKLCLTYYHYPMKKKKLILNKMKTYLHPIKVKTKEIEFNITTLLYIRNKLYLFFLVLIKLLFLDCVNLQLN